MFKHTIVTHFQTAEMSHGGVYDGVVTHHYISLFGLRVLIYTRDVRVVPGFWNETHPNYIANEQIDTE